MPDCSPDSGNGTDGGPGDGGGVGAAIAKQAVEAVEFVFYTFIPEPVVTISAPINRYFEGDNRGFTNDPFGETRYRTKQYFKAESYDQHKTDYRVVTHDVQAGRTYELDAAGNVIDEDTAEVRSWLDLRPYVWRNTYVMNFEFSLSAANPLVRFSPEIDYRARLQISTSPRDRRELAKPLERWNKHFWVTIDGFPNYEAYLRTNGGKWTKVFTHDHGTETPFALFGNAGDYTKRGWHTEWPLESVGGR